MRIRKTVPALLLTAALTFPLLLAACTPAAKVPSPSPSLSPSPAQSADGAITLPSLTAAPLPAMDATETDDAVQAAAVGANAFSFRLAAALYDGMDAPGENFVCSPLSAWLPLAALLNATSPAQRAALSTALGANDADAAAFNAAARRMLARLTRVEENLDAAAYGMEAFDPLSIANAVFVQKELTLQDAFAEAFLNDYLGQAMNVDFTDAAAVDAVNAWASEHTDGLIPKIVDDFHPSTIAALANAVYFSDRWAWEFDESETVQGAFHAAGGDSTASYMRRAGDEQLYYEDDTMQAMPLRFVTGAELWILLPKDGDAAALLRSLTPEAFNAICDGGEPRTGTLLLPRFSIDTTADTLTDALKALGVPLFDADAAPLTGGLVKEDVPVYLSGAVQKASIRVDEKGTTAAAVTVLEAAGAGMPIPTEPFTMTCDRPFVFVLTANGADAPSQVLFVGLVADPAK